MKTDNIYFADLCVTTDKKYKDTYSWTLFGRPLYDFTMYSKQIRKALVLYKEDEYGNSFVKDLNTNKKYSLEVPSTIGTIFANPKTFEPFNEVTGNRKTNLSKRIIKKLGNQKLY